MSEPHPAMRLLGAGVPLSLLLDLADPNGPDTRGIMEAERCAADLLAQALPQQPRTLIGVSAVAAGFVPGAQPGSA